MRSGSVFCPARDSINRCRCIPKRLVADSKLKKLYYMMSGEITEVVTLTFKPGIVVERPIKQLFEALRKQKGYLGGVWGTWEEAREKVQLFARMFRALFHFTFYEYLTSPQNGMIYLSTMLLPNLPTSNPFSKYSMRS